MRATHRAGDDQLSRTRTQEQRRHAPVLGFVMIIVVGRLVDSVVEKAVAAILRTIKLNDLARRA